jgi:hypothetical protein
MLDLNMNMNMKNTAHSTISALRRALFVSAALVGLSLGACDKDKSLGDEYKPCEGKSCGDPCQVCAPDDKDCLETQELKACDPNGQCVSDSEALMCEGGYEPCAGKSCGESCSICAPEDQDCVESLDAKACDAMGQCVNEAADLMCAAECQEGDTKMIDCNTCGCVDGMWGCTQIGCDDYDPCVGKACGDACTICDPNDEDCVESAELKACDPNGVCVAETPDLCEGAYVPCAGKVCGEMCTICDPLDMDCAEDAVIKVCDPESECVPMNDQVCP